MRVISVTDEIHLTVAIVQYAAPTGGRFSNRHGVCSNWLDSLSGENNVPCFIRRWGGLYIMFLAGNVL